MNRLLLLLTLYVFIVGCSKKSNDTPNPSSGSNVPQTDNNVTMPLDKEGFFYIVGDKVYQECFISTGFNACDRYGAIYDIKSNVGCNNANKPYSVDVSLFLPFDSVSFKKLYKKKLTAFDGHIPEDRCNKELFGGGCGCSAYDENANKSYSTDTLNIKVSATSKTNRYQSNILIKPTTIRDTSKYFFRVNKITLYDYGYHYVQYKCNVDYKVKMRNQDNFKDTFDLSGSVNGILLKYCTNGHGFGYCN